MDYKTWRKKMDKALAHTREASTRMETLALVYGAMYSEQEAPMTPEMRQAIQTVVRCLKKIETIAQQCPKEFEG